MKETFVSKIFKKLLPYFLFAVAIILVYRLSEGLGYFAGFLGTAWGVLSPFFYGFILAYIINMPISGMQKLLVKTGLRFIIRRQKLLSVLLVLLIIVGLIVLILSFVVPAIGNSISFLVENSPTYLENIMRAVDNFNQLELFDWELNTENVLALLGDLFADIDMESAMQPIGWLIDLGSALFTGAIAFISSIYILIEKDRFKKYLANLLHVCTPQNVNDAIIKSFGRLNQNCRQYIRTQSIDGLILGTMASIALLLLGSPFWLILGLMLGVLNYIPYFGSIFGTLIAVLVVMITQDFTWGLIAAAILFVIQQIDANIIQPRLMSGSFSLSPLLVIISITVGGAISGIFGMIIAIPIAAVLKDIFDAIIRHIKRKKFGDSIEETTTEI
ncbi:MAG: AI-2E family transporter [Oscillospiraceae bacterium]|nr:AI-2E family transporter [Oscillospiraceae bacterium]